MTLTAEEGGWGTKGSVTALLIVGSNSHVTGSRLTGSTELGRESFDEKWMNKLLLKWSKVDDTGASSARRELASSFLEQYSSLEDPTVKKVWLKGAAEYLSTMRRRAFQIFTASVDVMGLLEYARNLPHSDQSAGGESDLLEQLLHSEEGDEGHAEEKIDCWSELRDCWQELRDDVSSLKVLLKRLERAANQTRPDGTAKNKTTPDESVQKKPPTRLPRASSNRQESEAKKATPQRVISTSTISTSTRTDSVTKPPKIPVRPPLKQQEPRLKNARDTTDKSRTDLLVKASQALVQKRKPIAKEANVAKPSEQRPSRKSFTRPPWRS